MKWFTGDEHYNHPNIIKFCNRPFLDVREMNETLIANFNSIVKPGDETYHLGDFAWNSAYLFFDKLNGKHHLLIGNHDYTKIKPGRYELFFSSIRETAMVRDCHREIFCSHYAHRVWPKSHRGVPHLYAHSHGTLEPYGRSRDIGVDTTFFFPMNFEEAWDKLTRRSL